LTEVELGPYRLGIANDFGPRIVSLRRDDGHELLAQLDSNEVIEYPDGIYRFHGGHRLWASPEIPEITYANDDHVCKVIVEAETATVTAPTDGAGLAKTIVVSRDRDILTVEHTITGKPTSGGVAAWAITQYPLGGTAFIPMEGGDTGPRPNRNVVLWPYTKLDDPRLRFGEAVAIVEARDGPPLKIGVGPSPQRLGYLHNGWLFIKETVSPHPGASPDFGAVSQMYLGQGFCELESVGELVTAGERPASISERWGVVACDDENQALELISDGSRT
jgi:hypothetical protein